MSSGSETRKRTQIVKVRCTRDEALSLGAAAKLQGKSLSACVRDALISPALPAPKPRRRTPAADLQALARILAAAGKIGSNVNQLARVANTNGELPAARELESIWQEVNSMRSALMGALSRGN